MTEFTKVSNVWEAFCDDKGEAAVNKLKAQLMIVIRSCIVSNGWNQHTAAEMLGIDQPRVSRLVNGQVSKFSLDALYHYYHICGHGIDITLDKSDDCELHVEVKGVSRGEPEAA